jgi:hypothetical protein
MPPPGKCVSRAQSGPAQTSRLLISTGFPPFCAWLCPINADPQSMAAKTNRTTIRNSRQSSVAREPVPLVAFRSGKYSAAVARLCQDVFTTAPEEGALNLLSIATAQVDVTGIGGARVDSELRVYDAPYVPRSNVDAKPTPALLFQAVVVVVPPFRLSDATGLNRAGDGQTR